jgi:predicted TIM-barrel fold metal-dependent hydrolase
VHVDELLLPWLESLREAVPGLAPLDCHTHLGDSDPDGFRSAERDLLASLERAGARAVVFPMQEPGGYHDANDRVLGAAARDGRLTAFCRVDPRGDGTREVERSLAAGAGGIKLHPRAEAFTLSDPAVAALCALAADRRVPVLVHAGRGIPALGRDALGLCDRFPELALILAHAGVSDLSWIWRHAPDHPGLHFDTSWWSPVDLLALFALVPPGRILYGSDTPYGTPVQGAILALRCALQAGLSEAQARSVMGEQAERLLAGQAPLDLGPAPGEGSLSRDVLLDRVYTLLAAAVGRYLHGGDAPQEIALARLACEMEEGAPQAEVCRSILALLDRAERLPLPRAGASPQHPAAHLAVTAAAVARTPDVALPGAAASAPVAAGEA